MNIKWLDAILLLPLSVGLVRGLMRGLVSEIIAILAVIFRQACLRKGFFSILLSTALGMVCYELLLQEGRQG